MWWFAGAKRVAAGVGGGSRGPPSAFEGVDRTTNACLVELHAAVGRTAPPCAPRRRCWREEGRCGRRMQSRWSTRVVAMVLTEGEVMAARTHTGTGRRVGIQPPWEHAGPPPTPSPGSDLQAVVGEPPAIQHSGAGATRGRAVPVRREGGAGGRCQRGGPGAFQISGA
ncbi:hypothetical protein VPH35_104409 [Triticum aestivum]